MEGVGSGPTASRCFVVLLDLKHGMSWIGQIMCGLRCTLNHSKDGFIVMPVKTLVTNPCSMKRAGGRNSLTSLHSLMNRFGSCIPSFKVQIRLSCLRVILIGVMEESEWTIIDYRSCSRYQIYKLQSEFHFDCWC